jgi:hypothetical protein
MDRPILFWGATPQTPTVLAPHDPALGTLVLNQPRALLLNFLPCNGVLTRVR